MRSILVPTDFSETAANALEYAAAFANHFHASLLLFHAYHLPLMISEVPFTTTMEDFQLEESNMEQLKLIQTNIRNKYQGKVSVELLASPGLAVDEITSIAQEKECALIIMGTQGVRDGIGIWGSNSAQVIKHTQCDVLIIPDNVAFEPINKIAFAYDYRGEQDIAVYKTLIEIARVFRSEILIFSMDDNRMHPVHTKQKQDIWLEQLFENITHSYWFSEQMDIVKALSDFTKNNSAAMIAMIRKEHTFFQFFFKQSNTKKMALHTRFPLLVLHGKNDFR